MPNVKAKDLERPLVCRATLMQWVVIVETLDLALKHPEYSEFGNNSAIVAGDFMRQLASRLVTEGVPENIYTSWLERKIIK